MREDIQSLFNRYRGKGLLVDTNILLLYFVGLVNRERISKFNRTEKFTAEDFDLLIEILAYFSQKVTTPNVLTEVNSLINQIRDPERSHCLAIFSRAIASFNEVYLESKAIATNNGFVKLGLTDSGILEIAQDHYLVLTDDLKLAAYLQRQNIDTVNFNHLRDYG